MRSHLARHQPETPAGEDHLRAMRAAAWHRQGIVTLRPDEITDEWLRQALVNEAERRFGRRANGASAAR